MFAAYVSQHGHAFVDRALYLPKAWTGDAARMIERAIATEVPFIWVAADSVYGVGDIERALRRAGRGYVLGVAAQGSAPLEAWNGGGGVNANSQFNA